MLSLPEPRHFGAIADSVRKKGIADPRVLESPST